MCDDVSGKKCIKLDVRNKRKDFHTLVSRDCLLILTEDLTVGKMRQKRGNSVESFYDECCYIEGWIEKKANVSNGTSVAIR
jgi:hypothetical protein